jgi:hypothetical protein
MLVALVDLLAVGADEEIQQFDFPQLYGVSVSTGHLESQLPPERERRCARRHDALGSLEVGFVSQKGLHCVH